MLLDNGYHPEKLTIELKKIYPAIMTKIRFKLWPKPSKAQKENLGKTGFIPVKARWVIERTNSWMERCKSLAKNFVCGAFRRKRTLENAILKVNLCFVRLLLKRLAIA
nr:transposase [Okeania sp. SIO2C9]